MSKNASNLILELSSYQHDLTLGRLYMDESRLEEERARYLVAINTFISRYGNRDIEVYSAPGRSEVCGNHTDHQNGKVLAASVNIDTIAVVSKTDDNIITMKSKGYDEIVLDLSDLQPSEEEYGTTKALIRGVAAGLIKRGYKVGGFTGYCVTEVLSGSGLSSSAAYEVLIGNILSGLYNENNIGAIEIAQIAQEAENLYFGKPCGLMDQMACSVGGLIAIDFADLKNPEVKQVEVNFDEFGYSLCIIDTKGSHADLTDDYAAVPAEMKSVAHYFGCEVMNEVDKQEFYHSLPEVRKSCGDRAVMRAIHWFDETARVDHEVLALEAKDLQRFLRLVNESGDSSYRLLQNVYSVRKPHNQEVAIGIVLGNRYLDGAGVVRVHGGGFAGTIQAFVPNTIVSDFKQYMESIYGEGSCYCLKIRNTGGTRVF